MVAFKLIGKFITEEEAGQVNCLGGCIKAVVGAGPGLGTTLSFQKIIIGPQFFGSGGGYKTCAEGLNQDEPAMWPEQTVGFVQNLLNNRLPGGAVTLRQIAQAPTGDEDIG